MAAKKKKKAKPAAAPAGETGNDSSSQPPPSTPTRAQVLGLMAKTALKKASVNGIRPVLPLIEGYGRSQKIVEGKVPDIEKGGSEDFSPAEVAVLKTAGEKFAYEFIALASKSHPVDKTEPYIAIKDPQKDSYPAPGLPHLISALQLGRRLLGLEEEEDEQPPSPEGGEEEGGTEVSSGRVVLLNAVEPGEYVAEVGAIKPNQIRRIAMSQRQMSLNQTKENVGTSYAKPSSAKAAYVMAGSTKVAPVRTVSAKASYAQKAVARPAAANKCGCQGGGGSVSDSVARYESDGDCSSLFKISCETRWRLRQCLKDTLCDLLFCASSHVCEDGKFKGFKGPVLADCLGKAVCSLLQCIPNAICPPKQVCQEKPRSCQPCNFAVEEEV